MKTWEEYRTSLIKHGKECVLQNRLLVETRQKELEAWMQKAFAQFAHTISDKNFPCPFGQKSWAKGSTLFLFIKEPNDFSNLLRGMIEYTNFTKSTPIDNRILCPWLYFFCDTGQFARSERYTNAWNALEWIHIHDPERWPDEIPDDPDNPAWCFCFNGVQLFINMSSGEHKRLRNRNLCDFMTLVINPRENFDAVASLNTRQGRLLRENIRKRLEKYNNGFVPPELGFYGEESNKEWKQYQLEEEGMKRPDRCPFSHVSHSRKQRHAD